MKYTNITDDARNIPALGISVESGESTPDLSPDESAGFAGQVGVWLATDGAPPSDDAPLADPVTDDEPLNLAADEPDPAPLADPVEDEGTA